MRVRKNMERACIVLLLVMTAACGKTDREAMPITRENILVYQEKLVESQDTITGREKQAVHESPEKAAKVFRKTFVAPLEEMGYDYDRTVRAIAQALLDGTVPGNDPEVRAMAEGVIVMAKGTEPFAVKHGFISPETKKVLDHINVNDKP